MGWDRVSWVTGCCHGVCVTVWRFQGVRELIKWLTAATWDSWAWVGSFPHHSLRKSCTELEFNGPIKRFDWGQGETLDVAIPFLLHSYCLLFSGCMPLIESSVWSMGITMYCKYVAFSPSYNWSLSLPYFLMPVFIVTVQCTCILPVSADFFCDWCMCDLFTASDHAAY